METKELVIDVLNEAMKAFQGNGGKLYPGDVVVDYNPDTIRVASFIDRHPGWIKLYVTLEEGTGLFFLSSKTTMVGNICYIAWEEDNSFHTVSALLRSRYETLRRTDMPLYYEYLSQVEEELDNIITKGLF
jgi:hypothetical protein